MLCSSECWMTEKKIKQKMSVANMRRLRLISRVTREGRIRTVYVTGRIVIATIMEKMKGNRIG